MTEAPARPPSPPAAERIDLVETLHGVPIADPYRYLEDPQDHRTQAFVSAQNAVSTTFLTALPLRDHFLAEATALLTAPRAGVPWERGGRYFHLANPGELDQDQLRWAPSADELLAGDDRLLLDPNTWSADGAAALTGVGSTRDGRLLAYARSEAGSDWQRIGVVELTGAGEVRPHPDELRWSKWSSPVWLPDDRSVLYWRYPAPASADDPAALGGGELARHRLGTDQDSDETVWSRPDMPDWMAWPLIADDGRYLVLTASPGTDARSTVSVLRLTSGSGVTDVDPEAIEVVAELADAHHPIGTVGDTLYLRTERDAPTGALVTVDLLHPDRPWTSLIRGDDERVLVDAVLTGGGLCVQWSVDAAHRLERFDLAGTSTGELDIGGPVSVTALHGRADSSELFVGVSSYTERLLVLRSDTGDAGTARTAAGSANSSAAPVPAVNFRRVRAAADDGATVPMSVVRLADSVDGPAPTLLYGYGGFDIAVLPAFSALFAGWVRAGGVLAVANLRGGGEFGTAWHEAGMKDRKQRVFDDLYACAQTLIDSGITTSRQLAVHGRSNGGLLVGAALTQRPDLWAACLPTVGVLDMLRFHLFTVGWAWTTEYGSPDDPAEFAALRAYSPLHALRSGVRYPPTLICTGDHDDRVVPAHSLKFGAELQFCQQAVDAGGPVLLRIDTRAGHGAGKPAHALAAEYADQLAFAAHFTGLDSAGSNTAGV